MADVAGIATMLNIRHAPYCVGLRPRSAIDEKVHTLRAMPAGDPEIEVSFAEIFRQWGRIGCIGFGGPPAHVTLFRQLCVERRGWLSDGQFERAIAATNLLPGPASTQLAIYCAWRLRGPRGALVGGACFIVPGLIVILALSAVFLAAHPPLWINGAADGADAAVPVVALSAAIALG